MPWQRGHALSTDSALPLSQWNRGSSRVFDSTLHLSHDPPPSSSCPSPPHVSCHILTLPSRSLLFSCNATSVSALPAVSPSFLFLPCFHCPAPPHFFFLPPGVIDIRYESGLSWQSSFGTYPELVSCECSKKDQKDESRSPAAGKKSISVWLRWDRKDWDY